MAAVTIRNLSDATHRALKARAAQNHRSAEAEIRAILDAAVQPPSRVRLGTALSEFCRGLELTDEDVDALTDVTDRRAAQPMTFDDTA